MAVDMFIKIGDVEGEARDHAHGNEIDVLSWSWGMTQSGSMHVLGGGGAGKVNVQDLSFEKYSDSSSPVLMRTCCNGKHHAEAVLTIRKAGENPVEYLIITMKNVLVTSVSTGGSGGSDRITESVTLNFAEVQIDYQPQGADGAAEGGAVTMGWNIATNEATA